jgi:hypothetical protein
MNKYTSVTTETKSEYRKALETLKKNKATILLTHFDENCIFCEGLSEACISALKVVGADLRSAPEEAPVEQETAPWPPDVALTEGVHFDVRDEPETFCLESLYMYSMSGNSLQRCKAEISHPILGTLIGHFEFDNYGALVLTDELSFTYEGLPNPLELKTLKVKFLTEPFKHQVKYIDVNAFMGGLRVDDGNSINFNMSNGGGIEINSYT